MGVGVLLFMAKDPAMLWYWNDWNSGTVTMTRHVKGCYIDLLHAQFNNGHLSINEIKTVLGSDFSTWPELQKKFKQDVNGLFFNERLELEQNKRKAFAESRRENRKKTSKTYDTTYEKHMLPHMENENRNEDINRKGNENSEKSFDEKFQKAFDEITCERFTMTFPNADVKKELAEFRVKCDNDPADYHRRDTPGLRNAFQYQLKQAKTKPETKRTKLL